MMAVELRGRPTVASLSARLAKARDVNADLRDELSAAGQEMQTAGRRIEYAMAAGRADIALHVAGRLAVLGADYRKRGGS
jgi:hypothetical protein